MTFGTWIEELLSLPSNCNNCHQLIYPLPIYYVLQHVFVGPSLASPSPASTVTDEALQIEPLTDAVTINP